MRIAIVGTSGSGKTTLAKALAAQTGLPHIELDAVNWQAGWRDLSRTDPDEFVHHAPGNPPFTRQGALRTEMWAGNRERWPHMLRPSHPIRWAWSTWRRRRREYEERIGQSDYAHLVVLRLRRPREAEKLLCQLMQAPSALKQSALTGFRPAS